MSTDCRLRGHINQFANARAQQPKQHSSKGQTACNTVPTDRNRSHMAQKKEEMEQLCCVSHQELHSAGNHLFQSLLTGYHKTVFWKTEKDLIFFFSSAVKKEELEKEDPQKSSLQM